MPKLKTNKAAKKRYSITATGKVKRTTANRKQSRPSFKDAVCMHLRVSRYKGKK